MAKKKYKYVTEYEIHASVKMLYPYLSTASGLAEWFAEKVKIMGDKTFDIVWDNESHPARIISARTNSHVKYQFLPKKGEDESDLSFLEFKLAHSDMTDSAFIKIIDYSEMDNEKDLKELWDNLIDNLKGLVGAGNFR